MLRLQEAYNSLQARLEASNCNQRRDVEAGNFSSEEQDKEVDAENIEQEVAKEDEKEKKEEDVIAKPTQEEEKIEVNTFEDVLQQ